MAALDLGMVGEKNVASIYLPLFVSICSSPPLSLSPCRRGILSYLSYITPCSKGFICMHMCLLFIALFHTVKTLTGMTIS